jgi:hypothetical protein
MSCGQVAKAPAADNSRRRVHMGRRVVEQSMIWFMLLVFVAIAFTILMGEA